MTQQYCKGNFSTWDPKITTFPGLYVLGVMYAWVSYLLLGWTGVGLEVTCSGPYLRSLNALLAVVTVQLAYAVSCELQQIHADDSSSTSSQAAKQQGAVNSKQKQQQQHRLALGVALVVGLLPTQFFFAFLFYTDIASLLFLLLAELVLLRHRPYAAAAAGFAAISMRQTNAVWVAFLTGAAMLHDVIKHAGTSNEPGSICSNSFSRSNDSHDANNSSHSSQLSSQHVRCRARQGKASGQEQQQQQEQVQGPLTREAKPQQVQHSSSSGLKQLLLTVWQLRYRLLLDYWLLLLLPMAFCVFVVWNGGITLGDRAAHAPATHLMQPLYFAMFFLANAGLLLLQKPVLERTHAALSVIGRSPVVAVLGVFGILGAMALCVTKYSLVHPYLTADNRHYTFYLWRKMFAKHIAVRYLLVPVYAAGWALLVFALSVTQHGLWVAAFIVSCWVTLAPAWLLEFRYFTVPFVLAVLHMPPPPRALSLLVLAGYCCVNAVTLWVFSKRPYTWADGSTARFMW
eukprot:GHRR01011518.1.p1 GENE.GHRR01011518.1~~GHRR01011518.1.p1  ORF type:complete len:514 (+),score=169.48 GHRR01011518.1:1021-2562(+)